MVVKSFSIMIETARSLMKDGEYRQAFELIVDRDVHSLPDLLDKIACLVDIGFILRDEKILRYGIYLLEKNGSEVLEIPELGAAYFLNLAHQYANMVTLSSFNDEYYGFFQRAEQVTARMYYENVLSYDKLPDNIAYEAHKGLGQMYQSSGRGCEALTEYQKALKIKPRSREILHEKIRLMKEYALRSMPNRIEFLQEARALLDKSIEVRDDDDDGQEDMILRNRLFENENDPESLEEDGEYPVRTISFENEADRAYTDYCRENNLYLNLCTFCRKCEFALGDSLTLSNSSLTIRQGQKKRFIQLRKLFRLLCEKYATGRTLLFEAEETLEKKEYLYRSFFEKSVPEREEPRPGYHQMCTAFLSGWDLWDLAAQYISVFWDMDMEWDMKSLLYNNRNELKEIWMDCRSPAMHAVFDLYLDCKSGKDRSLNKLYGKLRKNEYEDVSWDFLRNHSLTLYSKMNFVIQYLGILHERNEFVKKDWDFPRPLYNFVSIQ